jgi:hypothetical protein
MTTSAGALSEKAAHIHDLSVTSSKLIFAAATSKGIFQIQFDSLESSE